MNKWKHELPGCAFTLYQSIYYKKNEREGMCVFVMEVGDKGTEETHMKLFTDYLACIVQTFLPFLFDWDVVPLSFSTR